MARNNSRKLRIYNPSNSESLENQAEPTFTRELPPRMEPSVRVSVAQVLPLLADAMDSRRLWLQDFHEDCMTISQDLYEVLLAYQRMRISDAA